MNDTRNIVQELLARLGKWDAKGISELFADNIEWYVPGSPALPWTGERTAASEVADFFDTMWSHFNTAESRPAVDTLIFDGDEAVILGSFSHVVKSTSKPFRTPFAMHLRVNGGKITRLHLYEDTLAVAQAFDVA